MDEVEEFVRLARDLAEEVVGLAIKLLSAGTDIAHVSIRSDSGRRLRHRDRPARCSMQSGSFG
jgi:hypothetical protein